QLNYRTDISSFTNSYNMSEFQGLRYRNYEAEIARSYWNVQGKPLKECFSSIGCINGQISTDKSITFINGIMNSFSDAAKSAAHISKLSGQHIVHFAHNPTHRWGKDQYECYLGLSGIATEPVLKLRELWDQKFA